MSNDNDFVAELMPKPYDILPLNSDGHSLSVEPIYERCLFCAALLDLPELLRQAVLDLAQALAASL